MVFSTEAPSGPSRIPIQDMPPPSSSALQSRQRRKSRYRHQGSFLHFTSVLVMLSLLAFPGSVRAQDPSLTLYTQATVTTEAAPSGAYTGLPAYDPTVLTPPEPPQPPTTSVGVAIPGSAANAQGAGMMLSIPQKGNFLGFSIELSVAPYVLGKSPALLYPQFLNYMANIRNRAGQGPIIRVGGNTQDSSTLYTEGFGNADSIEKIKVNGSYGNTVTTPIVNYSPQLLYTMSNVSSLVDAQWYFGLAFNETDVNGPDPNIPLAAQYAEQILGDKLLGLVIGNEPDLYVDHEHRAAGYNVTSYVNEYDAVSQSVLQNAKLSNQSPFVGPSVCCQVPGFGLQDVLNAGFMSEDNSQHISAVTVQHYPENNCQLSGVINPQDVFFTYLNHTSPQSLVQLYAEDTAAVRAAGKEMIMLETNTASCGGFPGLSDSFGAALWMTDYALQMAYGNFSAALIHFGGQGVYYNPFTPPPGSKPSFYQWTTGSVYYSALVVAEAFGQSNDSQIVDLSNNADNSSIYHPSYAIYENGQATRLVLFNYVSDGSGASNYQASVTLSDGQQMPSQVYTRVLTAPNIASQFNITWAGQSMGTSFTSDGRLNGQQQTNTVQCQGGTCLIDVPAPSIVLVFLSEDAVTASSPPADATQTYSTTVVGFGSATINPDTLETSNGQDGKPGVYGSNSKGASGAAGKSISKPINLILLTLFASFFTSWAIFGF